MSTKDTSEKIHAFLARAGVASRRASEQMVREGRVSVNGEKAHIGQRVSEHDVVAIDGKNVEGTFQKVSYVLHKPAGYITSSDPAAPRTVFELVPHTTRLFAVGRLDVATEGMLILTNDGDFAHHIMHPRFEIPKVYEVYLDRSLSQQDAARIEAGVRIQDEKGASYTATSVEVLSVDAKTRSARLRLHIGKNRIVRRIFEALHYEVQRLVRVQIGGLVLGDLPKGQYRILTPKDKKRLLSRSLSSS